MALDGTQFSVTNTAAILSSLTKATLDYLYRKNEYADLLSDALPDLILLDVNLPKVGGFEVLRQIRENEELRRIPCVMLTTSSASLDIEAARSLGATGYQIKPVSAERFTDLLNNWPSNLACFSQPPHRNG